MSIGGIGVGECGTGNPGKAGCAGLRIWAKLPLISPQAGYSGSAKWGELGSVEPEGLDQRREVRLVSLPPPHR